MFVLTIHQPDNNLWTLHIRYLEAGDDGSYECQVSTEPKTSHFVFLKVVVPQVDIIGGRDVYVQSGSAVGLRCRISKSIESPAYVFWYHNGVRVLEFKSPNLHNKVTRLSADTTVATLTINKIHVNQQGTYVCAPANLHNATVNLHTIIGEHQESLQTRSRGLCLHPSLGIFLLTISVSFWT